MNRKFLKKFMSRAGWRISDARLFMEHISDPAAHEPNLPELTLLQLVRQGLLSLRHNADWTGAGSSQEIETKLSQSAARVGENGEFDWKNPWVEVRYPVTWDWTRSDAILESPFKLPPAASGDRLDWLIKTSRRQQELLIFEVLTHGAARRRAGDKNDFIIPNPHHSDLINEALQDIPPEQHEKLIDDYVTLLLKPFTVGFTSDFDDETPDHILRRLEQVEAVRFRFSDDALEGVVMVQVHPLVVDEAEQRAYYPVVIGLSLWPRGEVPDDAERLLWKSPPADVPAWDAQGSAQRWNIIEAQLDALEQSFRTLPETGIEESLALPTPLPTPEIVALTEKGRYLLEGSTRMDKRAATLVAYAHGLNLPRKWSAIRAWQTLETLEIERLQKELGDAAFEARAASGRDKNTKQGRGERMRGAPLVRRVKPSGDAVIELSDEARNRLAEREGVRGFRKPIRDEDGVLREYVIKRQRTPVGYIEMRLSWYGMAWPLVSEAVEYRQSSLKALEVRSNFGQPSLFEELEERRRGDLDGSLRQMTAIRDAQLVMDLILRSFGRDGINPIHIPAWQLRALLECESDSDGFNRVGGCLRALQEVRFHLKFDQKGPGAAAESFGSFLGDVKYIGRGQGSHTDGDYYLQVSLNAIGCLQVFSSGQANSERVVTFDWNKSLSAEERDNIGGYVKGFLALAPYYDRAKGFTSTQSNLLRWIERELTLNKDAISKRHRGQRATAAAEEPRLYGSDFCPLLPRDLHFCAALGHFTRNPETGRRLHRSEGAGSANECLLAVMGQTLPSARARAQRSKIVLQSLQDMRAVVEEALGGYVMAWQMPSAEAKGGWLRLEQAAALPEKTLLNSVSWYLFVAPDFRDRLARDLEEYHAERFARGKTPYPIRVTRDSEEARKGHLQTAGEHLMTEDDAEPVRLALKRARLEKRLSQAKLGALFGVSQKTIDYWEKGSLPDESGRVRGKAIPRDRLPLVMRWIESGVAPSEEELAAFAAKRAAKSAE